MRGDIEHHREKTMSGVPRRGKVGLEQKKLVSKESEDLIQVERGR